MYRERHAGSCKITNEDGWIKTTYTSMQIGAVWNEGGSLIHLCIQRCNGYKISLNSRKITLAITKHKAPCSSASKSGEESRAAIQMLLLERNLFAARQLGPSVPRAQPGPVPARLERDGRAQPAPPGRYQLETAPMALTTRVDTLWIFLLFVAASLEPGNAQRQGASAASA